MINLLTEIIQKKQWREKNYLRSTVKNEIKFGAYKKNLKYLKTIFTKLNHGKFKSTIIFDYDSIKADNKKLNYADNIIIRFIQKLDYEVSPESYLLGFAKKDDKTVLIYDILETMRKKKISAMKKAWDKTGDDKIMKQIEALEYLHTETEEENIELETTHSYMIADEKKYKIVLSIQPRLIASQSTEVGWESCMSLSDGSNRHYVGRGIEQGVVVAYLVKNNDVDYLNSPSARVLLKPFKNENGSIVWDVDKIYGTAPETFRDKVLKIFEPFNSKEAGTYSISSRIYNDTLEESKLILNDKQNEMIDTEDFSEIDEESLKFIEYVFNDLNKYKAIQYIKNPSQSISRDAMLAYKRSEHKITITEFANMFKKIKSSPITAQEFVDRVCKTYEQKMEFIKFYTIEKILQNHSLLYSIIYSNTNNPDTDKVMDYVLKYLKENENEHALAFLARNLGYSFIKMASDDQIESAFNISELRTKNDILYFMADEKFYNKLIVKLAKQMHVLNTSNMWFRTLGQHNFKFANEIENYFEKKKV
jgi:hypothetical protein